MSSLLGWKSRWKVEVSRVTRCRREGDGEGGGDEDQRKYNEYFTLQRHCTEKFEKNSLEMKLRDLVPNAYIHVSVSDLYFPRSACLWGRGCSKIGGPIVGIYKSSQIHECENWEWGSSVSFLGIHKSDLFYNVFSTYKVQSLYKAVSSRHFSQKLVVGSFLTAPNWKPLHMLQSHWATKNRRLKRERRSAAYGFMLCLDKKTMYTVRQCNCTEPIA